MLILVAGAMCLRDDDLRKCAYEMVSSYRKSKSDAMHNYDDKIRSLAAGVLLNNAVRLYTEGKGRGEDVFLNMNMKDALASYDSAYDYEVAYIENGKPVYANCRDVHFNLSHSGDYVACVVSEREVGIDVEGHRQVRKGIAERFFSKEEFEWMSKGDYVDRFFRLWTIKEAYAKLVGKGIAQMIDDIHIDMDNDSDNAHNVNVITKKDDYPVNVRFAEYSLEPDYRLAVAEINVIINK